MFAICFSRRVCILSAIYFFFFFNDTATTEIYTLSLHDALPICSTAPRRAEAWWRWSAQCATRSGSSARARRSEEHTSELQSQSNLVCRLLLEKKKRINVECLHLGSHTSTYRPCQICVVAHDVSS